VRTFLERVKAGLETSGTATRAAVLTGLMFALGLAMLTVHALRVFEARYLQLVGDRQFEMVRAHASRLDDKLRTAQAVLAGVARTMDAQQLADARRLQQMIDSRVFLHVSFDQGIRVYDAAGSLVAQRPADGMALPAAQEAWLRGLAGRAGTQQVSAPFSLSPTQARPGLLMTAPIVDAGGRVIGTLAGGLALLSPHYTAGMQDYRVGAAGYLFITTADRVMLMHPQRERLLRVAAVPGQNAGYDRAIEQRLEGTVETRTSDGRDVLVSYARLPFLDWVLGANFPMSEARAPFLEALDAVRWPLLLVAAALTTAVGVTVHRLMRPIRQLSQRLLDVGEGRARAIDVPAGASEVAVLARAYNRMLSMLDASEAARRDSEAGLVQANETLERRVHERTEAIERTNAELNRMLERNARMQAELVQSEKQAALGRLVAGLGHELSTPMGNALMVSTGMHGMAAAFGARAAEGGLDGPELERFATYCRDSCELIERNLSRANRLVTSFKQSAVDQIAERRRRFDLRQTIEEVIATLEHLMKFRPLQLHLALAPDIEMDSYPGALGQALTNMFINALGHGFGPEQPGDIWISARHENADEVRIEVRDNGRGIEPGLLGKVFDPFFTTRLGQGGSGLGLYIVFNAVTGPLRGRIEVRSEPGSGAAFIMTVPRVAGDPDAAATP